jgi:hypothetical protein
MGKEAVLLIQGSPGYTEENHMSRLRFEPVASQRKAIMVTSQLTEVCR